ncbi:odorant receptor 85c-like isoform X2 [Pseudomyrmex gracilis]|uniref:odorant receptor 85c-like isoform X2 n=1 Tax=Pseudomyrmex gracilis TaxID=219809 RepID=UPI000995CB0A|nr:odorant receptor 85c-like isoform X2 [Pseudomyrmex gracilis]
MLAIIILVKIFTYQLNSQKIRDLTDHLFSDWNMLETREEYDIMRQYAERGRQYALMYGIFIHTGTICFATTALVPRILDVLFPLNISRPIILICPAYYFVDEEQYFYYIFCHTLTVAAVCLTGLIAHDCMFFTYVEHVCGLFAVVGFRFEHAVYKRSKTKECLRDYSDVYCKNIEFSIFGHQRALQFAILLEDVFYVSFAVQILIVSTGLSITLVQMSMQIHDNNLTEAPRYIVFIIAQVFHVFLFSFEGQKLIDHTLIMCNKIYNGSWYDIPVKAQRLFLFAMRKSIEVNTLSAGKIYVFSLENFTTLLQTSVSYFTVLVSTNSFD